MTLQLPRPTPLAWTDLTFALLANRAVANGMIIARVEANGHAAWIADDTLRERMARGWSAHVETRALEQSEWPIDEINVRWAGDTAEAAQECAERWADELTVRWKSPP